MKIKLISLALAVSIGLVSTTVSGTSEPARPDQPEGAYTTKTTSISQSMINMARQMVETQPIDVIARNDTDGRATDFNSPFNVTGMLDLLQLSGVWIDGKVRFDGRPVSNVSLTNWGHYLYAVGEGASVDAMSVKSDTVNYGIGYLLAVLQQGKVESFTNNGLVTTDTATVMNEGELRSFTNNGDLVSLKGEALLNEVTGVISGDVVNTGTIEGVSGTAIKNKGAINGNIINTGNIKGYIENKNSLKGGIKNDGTMAGIYNEGNIESGIENSGTIAGIYNAGIIGSSIVNKGTVTDAIYNGGTLGTVELGGAQLILVENKASAGAVNGNDDSGIWIGHQGSSTIPAASANFTATHSAAVGSLHVLQGSSLTLADNLNWQAKTIINNGKTVLGNGSALTGTVENAGTLALSDGQSVNAGVKGDLANSGTLVLNPTPQSAGNTLTIDGNYTGVAGSKISFGSVLGGDNSLTDRLIITGNSDGSSALSVTNVGGIGSSTLEGLRLIQINGNSDATFALDGRLVAGIWDYSLVKGNTSGTDSKSWYLTSYTESTPPDPTPDDSTPDEPTPPAPAPDKPALPDRDGEAKPVNPVRKVRPEAASYAANLRAANTLFNTSLSDRVGETQYLDPLTGEVHTTSMWMRNLGGHNRASLSDGQNKISANRYVLQIGGDIMQWSSAQAGRLSLGVMGGYANQKSHSRNSLSGYDSRSSVNGYSAGLYGTWYQHASDKAGLYADSWVQYNWFNNEVKGQDLAAETYKSHGLTASLESGYNYRAGSWISGGNMENSLWLRPHAQVIWMGVKASDHTESNGTRVTGEGDNNIQTRLGLRTYINGKSVLDKNSGREFQPFVEANWIYNSKQYGAALNGDKVHTQGSRNIGELKVGVEGKLSNRLSLWTDVAQQMGGSGYNDTQGTLGVRYQF